MSADTESVFRFFREFTSYLPLSAAISALCALICTTNVPVASNPAPCGNVFTVRLRMFVHSSPGMYSEILITTRRISNRLEFARSSPFCFGRVNRRKPFREGLFCPHLSKFRNETVKIPCILYHTALNLLPGADTYGGIAGLTSNNSTQMNARF